MRIGYPMLYFLKFKDLTCNFCAFSLFFFYFLVSFYPIWMKILSKFRENVGLQAYHLGLVLNRSWTAVFSGLSQKNWEAQDRWSAWTGYSLVRFSVPFWSYEPGLEALKIIYHSYNFVQCFQSPSAILKQTFLIPSLILSSHARFHRNSYIRKMCILAYSQHSHI